MSITGISVSVAKKLFHKRVPVWVRATSDKVKNWEIVEPYDEAPGVNPGDGTKFLFGVEPKFLTKIFKIFYG
jgi:hypothetical protein